MADNYPDVGTKRYRRELAKGYKEGGLTKTKDKTSVHYSGLDRDVTKRGIDPYSDEAYKSNRAIKKRIGFAERSDDQNKSSREDYRKVAKGKSDSEMDKVESGKPVSAAKADPDSYKKGGKVRKTGMALVHKGERVLTKKQQRRVGFDLGGKSKRKSPAKLHARKKASGKR